MPRTLFSRLRALLLLLPVLLLTGCSKSMDWGFPEGVSSVNDASLSLWQGAWIAAGVVGVITLILILWPAVFHRGKKDGPEFPKQTQYNVPVEIAYTIIPFIIVAVLFFYTLSVKISLRKRQIPTLTKLLLKVFNGHGGLVIQRLVQMQS